MGAILVRVLIFAIVGLILYALFRKTPDQKVANLERDVDINRTILNSLKKQKELVDEDIELTENIRLAEIDLNRAEAKLERRQKKYGVKSKGGFNA